MTFSQFQQLVSKGENSHVDFKLTCNAFNRNAGAQDKARAELVKDICAMANNGNSTSYLIIGVGDDGKHMQSVTDPNLNSQNIQTLVRDAIHPRPFVRLHRHVWSKAPAPFRGVTFVVLQIGPNPKQAFRLARDFINWSQKFYFRKHEVWIRNQDTNDLATPEQIARLLGTRRFQEATPDASYSVTEYQKLPMADQLVALSTDVQEFVDTLGAPIAALPPEGLGLANHVRQFRVCLTLRNKPFVFRCVFLRRLASESDRIFHLRRSWTCEHGVLIFVIGTASAAGKLRWLRIDSTTTWGSFGILPRKYDTFFSCDLPSSFADVAASIITISKLNDTTRLRESFATALRELETDDILFRHPDSGRSQMNDELRRWHRMSPANVAKAFGSHASGEAEAFRRLVQSSLQLMNARKRQRSKKSS